jgi:acyl-coenzyme A synthetase/AMP-(fatty) acid ligase
MYVAFALCAGKPKAVLHTSAGYAVGAAATFKYVFDYKPGDIYWCTADCGWITGHSYVTYGEQLILIMIVSDNLILYPNMTMQCFSSHQFLYGLD